MMGIGKTSKGTKVTTVFEAGLILHWGIRLVGTFFNGYVKGSKGGIDMPKMSPRKKTMRRGTKQSNNRKEKQM
jgi:hypothetical protein